MKEHRFQFKDVAAIEGSPNWDALIARPSVLYEREGDIRTPFARDYTRILHSQAYRRLKHKTQVFFNIDNDHICTRMEHVAHVESVATTIAHSLGLNEELTRAIATGHDLGHAPFGHHGENVLSKLCEEHLNRRFWHERNGLRLVDKVELLKDYYNRDKNLDLTYAVRDGIISHCGEIDCNGLKPRKELIDLEAEFLKKGQYQPATWEGCVVKLADKIAYVGRDIEDAKDLGFLSQTAMNELTRMAQMNDEKALNTTVIIYGLIADINKNSSPDKGICMSDEFFEQLKALKSFNYKYIYQNDRLVTFEKYAELVINELFGVLFRYYDGRHSFEELSKHKVMAPTLIDSFIHYASKYCDPEIVPQELVERVLLADNEKIYGRFEDKETYAHAIIDYISGMTDRFAVKAFNEMLIYD